MKILVNLHSVHYTDEQNTYCLRNEIEIDWDLPVLPMRNDLFHCNSIIGDKMPEFDDEGLCWSVVCVNYSRSSGNIRATVFVKGE